jgi:hypothetical protein
MNWTWGLSRSVGAVLHATAATAAKIAAFIPTLIASVRWVSGTLRVHLVPTSLLWILRQIKSLAGRTGTAAISLLSWLLVPKGAGPFEALKHYVSVLIGVIGLTALFWAAAQIATPPIVIRVAELPEPIKKEAWLNQDLSRSLIEQIEQIRRVVRAERDPNFEAVLNPPNIVIKTGEWSLNLQEQLLTPLGALLGRSPGEVHLTLTCFHPGCLRTSDAGCSDILPPVKAGEGGGSEITPKVATSQRLCLRIFADIRRGRAYRRESSRLSLDNDNYQSEMSNEMARIAEAVTTVADPATAALYLYLQAKQVDVSAQASTDTRSAFTERQGEAFEAAQHAEMQDAVSECWAHSVRAHIAIDRREYRLAESYIERAERIRWWRHLRDFKFPVRCRRLVGAAKTELARQLALWRPAARTFPIHSDDDNSKRSEAAFQKITEVLDDLGGGVEPPWMKRVEAAVWGTDQIVATRFARAEIGLSLFGRSASCAIFADPPRPDAIALDAKAAQRVQARAAISSALARIDSLGAEGRLGPRSRRAAAEFVERLPRRSECIGKALSIAERLYLSNPHDPRIAGLVAELLVTSVLSDSEKEARNEVFQARSIYERMVDIGDDKVDVFALGRLATFRMAFATEGTGKLEGPDDRVLDDLRRAWRRFVRERYPRDARSNAETVLALWGAVLLTSYPEAVLESAEGSTKPRSNDASGELKRDATVKIREFLKAAHALYPSAEAKQIGELAKMKGLGSRIGCLCMLTLLARNEDAGARYFLTKVTPWQRSSFRFSNFCESDLELDQEEDDPPAEPNQKDAKKISPKSAKAMCRVHED